MENTTKTPEIDGFEAPRQAILDHCLALAPFDGWTGRMFADAIRAADIDAATAKAAFPAGRARRDQILVGGHGRDDGRGDDGARFFGAADSAKKSLGRFWRALMRCGPTRRLCGARRRCWRRRPRGRSPLSSSGRRADTIWRGLGDKSTDYQFLHQAGDPVRCSHINHGAMAG